MQRKLKQSFIRKAKEPVFANDDMIYQVDIHSSTDLVTWGELAPEIYQKGIPTIKDINETTGSVSMEYLISAKDPDGTRKCTM